METAYRTAYVYVRETFAGHLRETDSGYSFLYDEKYLEETFDCIINQSFGFEKVQLVLVDDGSTDNSGQVCKKYQQKSN